ncbi:Nif3-like dinuclear metal center hexameric protein [Akkermansiaceae bacterium]|nr:Nif3-like dinuclear metal center hexameric protein [Akkermansiaceae bacterium]
MANLDEIVAHLDAELRVSEIKDYPGAMNGLQLANDGEVARIFSAVDASLAVIEEASSSGGGLLLVHHGIFWQGVQPLTGPFYRKIRAAMDGNLAIYSSHLPLDVHPFFGNNVLLAQAIGLEGIAPVFPKDGFPMGVAGDWGRSRDELAAAVGRAVGRDVTLCPAGGEEIRKVAVITGGAGSEVARVAASGMDAFVTGEGSHWTYVEAEERGLNVIYAGHYATETFGVRFLSEKIAARFGLECGFISRPGGL